MAKGRYITGLVFGVIAMIVAMVFMIRDEWGFGVALLLGYFALSVLSQLIWWRGVAVQVFLFVAGISLYPIRFSLNLMGTGAVIPFILGLFLFFPTLSFLIGGVAVAFMAACVVAGVTFPYFLIAIPKTDMY